MTLYFRLGKASWCSYKVVKHPVSWPSHFNTFTTILYTVNAYKISVTPEIKRFVALGSDIVLENSVQSRRIFGRSCLSYKKLGTCHYTAENVPLASQGSSNFLRCVQWPIFLNALSRLYYTKELWKKQFRPPIKNGQIKWDKSPGEKKVQGKERDEKEDKREVNKVTRFGMEWHLKWGQGLKGLLTVEACVCDSQGSATRRADWPLSITPNSYKTIHLVSEAGVKVAWSEMAIIGDCPPCPDIILLHVIDYFLLTRI